jgi:hypothetical protein
LLGRFAEGATVAVLSVVFGRPLFLGLARVPVCSLFFSFLFYLAGQTHTGGKKDTTKTIDAFLASPSFAHFACHATR